MTVTGLVPVSRARLYIADMRAVVVFLLIATPALAAGLTDDGSDSDRYWSRQQRVGPKADAYPEVSPRGLPQGARPARPETRPTPGALVLPPEFVGVPQGIGPRDPPRRASSYVRKLLNYDIAEECRKGIYSMGDAIASGGVVPSRDVPRCIGDDTQALSYLDANWNSLPQEKRDACLAAFGAPNGRGLMMRYHVLATCMGRPL